MAISTESYKGVRDFYPEDMFIENYLFDTMKTVAKRYGYSEYGASILEPTELYKAKSGEEIVNEQTYSFKDRGDREVTLRPEMTPTVARMVAGRKRELAFPLRWFSIPNLFRYEKPQRGRLREHYQLNVDIFGIESTEAEKEIITLIADMLAAFGAKTSDFEIRISSRKVLNWVLNEYFKLDVNISHAVTKILDRKNKTAPAKFQEEIEEYLGSQSEKFIELFSTTDASAFKKTLGQDIDGLAELENLIADLRTVGISNATFDPTLTRGFDYYTGIVFEVYDTDKANPRALFGGGRYDDLLSIFESEKVPAVGFGMGDVGIRDFLETRGLLPAYTSPASLYIAHADSVISDEISKAMQTLAKNLRSHGINTVIDFSEKKIGDQLKKASRDKVPFSLVIGSDELSSQTYKLKNMESGEVLSLDEQGLINHLS